MRASTLAIAVTMLAAATATADAACRTRDFSGAWATYSANGTVCRLTASAKGKVTRSACDVGNRRVGYLTGSLKVAKNCTVSGSMTQVIFGRPYRFTVRAKMNKGRDVITGTTRSADGILPFRAVRQ